MTIKIDGFSNFHQFSNSKIDARGDPGHVALHPARAEDLQLRAAEPPGARDPPAHDGLGRAARGRPPQLADLRLFGCSPDILSTTQ